MVSITVGQVSAIIAAFIFAIQHLLPNALILILVAVIKNQHSAVTWSVVQRQIFSSLWPMLLSSDATSSAGVNPMVRAVALLRPLGLALVAVAAVVTPLGLHDAVVPSTSYQPVPFSYLADTSPVGQGTPPQGPDITFVRQCGSFGHEYAANLSLIKLLLTNIWQKMPRRSQYLPEHI